MKIKDEEILPRLLADDAFLKSIQEFSMFDPDLLDVYKRQVRTGGSEIPGIIMNG